MPTLTFTEGDTAEIHVHNLLKEETSLHWHGLFLPNKEDGVPNLTQMPIKPNLCVETESEQRLGDYYHNAKNYKRTSF